MKILFDQGTPVPLRRLLAEHTIATTYELGWAALTNGKLLAAAEQAGYELLITTDQNLRYQQQLAGRPLTILVLMSTSWPRIKLRGDAISALVNEIQPGSYHGLQV